METWQLILLGVVALGLLGLALLRGVRPWRRRREKRLKVLALQELYLRRIAMPRRKGRRVLARAVERLSDRHPDRSLEWILEKLLDELERERG